jgi:hypothetical protein
MNEIKNCGAVAGLEPLQEDTSRLRSHATPRTTIEAIMWCVRERGPQALHESANIERLRRCDDAAIAQIDARMTKLGVEDAP